MNIFRVIRLAAGAADELRRQLRSPLWLEDITPEFFQRPGIQAVILDHDGVLGPMRSHRPDATGMKTLEMAIEALGAGRVFILSNTRSKQKEREEAYANLPIKTIYIKSRKKPDAEGLMLASKISGAAPENIAVLDDGPLTGILMALTCGARAVYTKRRKLEEPWRARAVRLLTTVPQIVLAKGVIRIWAPDQKSATSRKKET